MDMDKDVTIDIIIWSKRSQKYQVINVKYLTFQRLTINLTKYNNLIYDKIFAEINGKNKSYFFFKNWDNPIKVLGIFFSIAYVVKQNAILLFDHKILTSYTLHTLAAECALDLHYDPEAPHPTPLAWCHWPLCAFEAVILRWYPLKVQHNCHSVHF